MKKTIYLHIGSGKTGTTSIQQMLVDNQENLENNNYLYLIDSPNISHSNIVNWGVTMKEDISKSFSILKNELLSSSCNNMIISSENMMGLNIEYLNMIKKIFGNQVTVKIIAYVRNQIEHLPTHFLQKQKDPLPYPGYNINSFFNKFKNIFGNEPNFIMNHWAKVFGKENIIVRVYDKEILVNKNVCEDFAKALNIDPFIISFDYFQNDSLIPETSYFIAYLDQTFPCLLDESYNFRQNIIIKKLLKLSSFYKNDENKDKMIELVSSIEDDIKIYFKKLKINNSLSKELSSMKKEILSKKKLTLINSQLKDEILDYYQELNYQFASKYLNSREEKIFLKYYKEEIL